MEAMTAIARWFPKLILIAYFCLLFVGLMLPSDGNHGLMSPKSLSFLGTCYLVIVYLFYRNQFSPYQYKLIGFTFCSIAFLLVWLAIGVALDPEGFHAPFDQFKIFVITIVFTIVTLYLVSEKIVKPETILRGVVYINLSYSLLKVFGMALHLLGIIKIIAFIEKTGIRLMSMDITEGISRLQTSVDIITPFLVYFVLQSPVLNLRFGRRFRYFFCLVSLLSILLSFSRFLLFVGLLSAFLYWFTLQLPRFTKALLFFLLLAWGGVMFVGIDETQKIIYKRFESHDNFMSDQTRVEQIEAMILEFDQHQLLGKGLGGSAPKYLRDGEITHSYEVQWVAFLMQFGTLGILFLFIPLLYIINCFLIKPITRTKLGFIMLFILWLLSGFTNPYLISLTSGIVYASFLLAADILSPIYTTELRKA